MKNEGLFRIICKSPSDKQCLVGVIWHYPKMQRSREEGGVEIKFPPRQIDQPKLFPFIQSYFSSRAFPKVLNLNTFEILRTEL